MSYYPVDIEKSVAKECKGRRLSSRTAKTYIYCINKFLEWLRKDIGKISKKDGSPTMINIKSPLDYK